MARLGGRAVLDETGRAFRDLGLMYVRMDEDEIVEKVSSDARLLRLPLVRMGGLVTAGPAEPEWRGWLSPSSRG